MIPQLQRDTPVSSPEIAPYWSLPTRVVFRFFFCYFLLYVYPRSIGSLGAFVQYNNPLRDLWHAVVPWVGTNILHITANYTEVANGSGDQIYDWVQVICVFVTAVVAAAIWSGLDRKRTNYETLYQWLRILVRLTIAVAMMIYGADKLFRMQFAEPALWRYVDSYGRTSPMGLLWAFMGMSHGYSFMGGVGEMAGALLLLVPRFTTLGAIVTLGMMSNVLMLNLFYDVPRKIYSTHLILFCLFLLLPDMRRLLDFFLLNRKTQLTPPHPVFKDQRMNYGLVALQITVGVIALIFSLIQAHKDQVKNETHMQAPLRGIWAVTDFSIDNSPRPPLLTDTDRWQRLILDAPKVAAVQEMDGSFKDYYLQLDAVNGWMTFWDSSHPTWNARFKYDVSNPNVMTLEGHFGSNHISAKLDRVDMSDPVKFLLLNRGFHWVTDYPHNR